MKDFAWLAAIATKADFEVAVDDILKQQSSVIQTAYSTHDSIALRNALGDAQSFACKNTVFHY